jgi:SSS family solute:Na+ symporter
MTPGQQSPISPPADWIALTIFVGLFGFVTILGFVAARWKSGNLNRLEEWGLGGRRFGPFITWFLIGGDAYTAYTIIAVPAIVYATGAYGFFALPYAVIIYPLIFLLMPRLWSICKQNNYITVADLVADRYQSKLLAGVTALTGILATMPYIALQLEGMRVVVAALGFTETEIPLAVAFIVLAIYTITSGLRAPAAIAFVKDLLIYVVVFAAVFYLPFKLGGYGAIFAEAERTFAAKGGAGILLRPSQFLPFATLALGSALALMVYPHTITGFLSASGPSAIRKNAIALPAYNLLLGLVGLLGIVAVAAGIHTTQPNAVVPLLIRTYFPSWFTGLSFAAIWIAALVPAAIMSIGAANLFTRNLLKPFLAKDLSERAETNYAKLVSFLVKVGALLFVLCLPTQFAIDLQLFGGIWILQTFPAVVFGLYKNRFHAVDLLLGWIVGMICGTFLAYSSGFKPIFSFSIGAQPFAVYIGLIALSANLAAGAINLFCRRVGKRLNRHA